jgi:GT2 family glycosyltransferase
MNEILPIIILNWNGITDTEECIDSILNSTYKDFKIFLVDNNSARQEGAKLLAKYDQHSQIQVILNEENLGFGAAHNNVIEHYLNDLTYGYICLINNDATVKNDCLRVAIDYAHRTQTDVLSMKMINYYNNELMDNAGHKVLTNGEILPIGSQKKANQYNNSFDNVGASGGACLYSKACIERIGLYDSYFFLGYEDAEYGLRARLAGLKCSYCPRAVVFHKGGQSIKTVFNQQYAVHTYKNISYTNYKLLPWSVLILMLPLRVFRKLAIIMVSLLLMRWSIAQVMITSTVQFYLQDLGLALKARKELRNRLSIMGLLDILSLMSSTIVNDITKFYSIFVKNKPTAIDKYR